MRGIAPATAQFPPPPPLPQRHRRKPGPSPPPPKGAPPGSSIAGNWSGQLTQVGSQTPYKFELVIGRRGAQTTYPDSTARERLLASGRRNPMSSSSRSLLRARLTKVDAVPTVPSRLPEQIRIWRCSGLGVSKPTRSSLTALSQKGSMDSHALCHSANWPALGDSRNRPRMIQDGKTEGVLPWTTPWPSYRERNGAPRCSGGFSSDRSLT